MVSRNVATLVEPPRAVRSEVRALKPAEVHALIDAARGDRFEAILTVAIAVGLRPQRGCLARGPDRGNHPRSTAWVSRLLAGRSSLRVHEFA